MIIIILIIITVMMISEANAKVRVEVMKRGWRHMASDLDMQLLLGIGNAQETAQAHRIARHCMLLPGSVSAGIRECRPCQSNKHRYAFAPSKAWHVNMKYGKMMTPAA
eukprot:4030854-Karenia_brevis.AAC.1